MKNDIVVVGSINMDMVFHVEQLPVSGETVRGDFTLHPGGKGANQAVAAARMGAAAAMVGCVGNDQYGKDLLAALKLNGVDCSNVLVVEESTGCAGLMVDSKGDNYIAVHSGANGQLTPGRVNKVRSIIAGARILMVQMEVPQETVKTALKLARAAGVVTILDPAPAQKLDPELLALVDFITPNAREAATLMGSDVNCWQTAANAARQLRGMGVKNALVTMGKLGAFFSSSMGEVRIPTPSVQAVDSTAAGDAFNGALAAALINGASPDRAADFAAAAGALTAGRPGAQPSLPTLAEMAKVVTLPW